MELHFLGRGAAFYPTCRSNSCFFQAQGDLYLIDCGETVFERLFTTGLLEDVRDVYVLITHMHADHVGSLASLLSYLNNIKKIQAHVAYPDPRIRELLSLQGIAEDIYHYAKEMPDNPAHFKAVPVQVTHAPGMSCFGYVLSDDETVIYYSGDSNDIPDDVTARFLKGEISRIYQDTAMHESAFHCHYKKMTEKIPEKERARIFCMHLDSDCEAQLKAEGFSVVTVNV